MELTRRSVLALPLVLLCGCTGEEPAAAMTLRYWRGGLAEPVVEEAVTAFGIAAQPVAGAYEALAGGPGIVAIKGEDIAGQLVAAESFVDLNTLGAGELGSSLVAWKLRQGRTVDGQQIGLPTDVAPTVLFYRSDLVDEVPGDWEGYLQAGERLRRSRPELGWLRTAAELFMAVVGQAKKRFVDERNRYVGDQEHVERAWNLAVELIDRGLGATAAKATGVATAIGPPRLGAGLGEPWRAAIGPVGGGTETGGFLAVPATGSDHTKGYEVIRWLLAPDRQTSAFTAAGLYPSSPAAYLRDELDTPDAEVFAAAAAGRNVVYESPTDAGFAAIFVREMAAVDAGRVSGIDGWAAAQRAAEAFAEEQGVD